jgi:GNAT superfamily N-acetyltransferase
MVVYLLNQRQKMHGLVSQVEEVRQDWQTYHFNPAMDVRLVFDQREHLIGTIEVWTMYSPFTQLWLCGCVHPDYEGQGIGTALLRWAEARVRLAMDMLPVEQRVAPRFGALHDMATVPALCEALGWQRADQDRNSVQLFNQTPGVFRLLGERGFYDVYTKESW